MAVIDCEAAILQHVTSKNCFVKIFTRRDRYSNPFANPINFDRESIRQKHSSGYRLKLFRAFEL